MAEKIDAAVVHYCLEAGSYLLMVRHAHRIGAFSYADHLLRDGNLVLVDDFVVLDDIYGGLRSDEGYAVQLVVLEIAVSDFDSFQIQKPQFLSEQKKFCLPSWTGFPHLGHFPISLRIKEKRLFSSSETEP